MNSDPRVRPVHDGRPVDTGVRRGSRTVILMLSVATAIGSTGLAAGGTAGALLGSRLAHTAAGAGLPPGLLVVGSAAGALLISRQTARGRRGRGLMLGYLLGAAGAAVVVASAMLRGLPLLLAGSTVLGAANSAVFLTRYAALEAAGESGRGRALGAVFFATAVGAITGPLLMGPSGRLAEAVGLPGLTGLYLLAIAAFGIAALLYAGMSNPRVRWLGRTATILTRGPADPPATTTAVSRHALSIPRIRLALACLAGGNFVMAGLMTVAPLLLTAHGHGLGPAGTVIALHVAGMFGPSPISGRLADRAGPIAVVLTGGALLLSACAAGVAADGHGAVAVPAHLLLLGVGWNFTIVGASALLVTAAPGALRARAEAVGEVTMGAGAAVASPAAGVAAALGGYWTCSIAGAVVALGLMAVAGRVRAHREVPSRAAVPAYARRALPGRRGRG